jgi:hypothetical protein
MLDTIRRRPALTERGRHHGLVDQPSYSVRLPSGQTLVIERERLACIRFRSR